MPSLRSVAAISLLAGLSASSPIDASSTKGAYSIKQVHMGYYQKNPALNMAATYAKFGGLMPYELAQAAANNNTGSAPTNPGDAHDSLYLTPVNVGGTTMMLDFDTGSADLWVFSSELPASKSAGHAIYKPDAAKKMDGSSWKISYGDGSSASGDVYKDTVTVGGIAVDGQAVEAASQISKQFASDKKNDGLLGLAFSSINTVQPTSQTTWVKTAIDAGDLKEAVFAAKLEHQKPGSYDFGFIDDSAYTGELAYTDIDNSQGFWSLKTDGYAVGSSEKNTPITGIADTGTTLIYVPTAVANDYYSQVNGAKFNSQYGGYVFDCSAELPDFSLTINGEKRTTPGEFVNYSPISSGSNTCFGGIQRNTGLQGLSIFGDIFLKSQYVVFDMAQNRIGFAPQASS